MTRCKSQFDIDADSTGCSSDKLIHPGRVPLSICEICPYRVEPDFFSATDRLYTVAQLTGQYVANPQPCGGCGDGRSRRDLSDSHSLPAMPPLEVPAERSREAESADVLQFVWVYWHGGAKGDELRWSMRSVEKHYAGRCRFTVIGDRPPWYAGHVIPAARYTTSSGGFERGLRDVLRKMEALTRHPDIDSEFVWMMDDTFFLQPVTREQLAISRAAGQVNIQREAGSNRYQTLKTLTGKRLARNGYQWHDFGTHGPLLIEKQKLADMFKVFDPLTQLFIWDVAYPNFHRQRPASLRKWLIRIKRPQSAEWYDRAARRHMLCNLMGSSWCESLRNWLADQFPQRHAGETGPIVVKQERLPEGNLVDNHLMLVQSAYADRELSWKRLELSKLTVIPSLSQQTGVVQVVVAVCTADPFLQERIQAFRTIRQPLRIVYQETPVGVDQDFFSVDWRLPGGRLLISRCDDDDILPIDFVQLTRQCGDAVKQRNVLLEWPHGYVWHQGRLHRFTNRWNQFSSLVTDLNVTPHDWIHKRFEGAWPKITVNNSKGWCWVRHGDVASYTKPKYLRQSAGNVRLERWPVDIRNRRLLDAVKSLEDQHARQ